jgi:signal transduction histidine kinase
MEPLTETPAAVTVRVLKHELRTPINHIIGYSEMILEDLVGAGESADHHAVAVTHAVGKELLALVNSTLGSTASPDALAAPDLVAALRDGVQRSVDRMHVDGLTTGSMANTPSSSDVTKILGAASRLADFARTGHIRNSEVEIARV